MAHHVTKDHRINNKGIDRRSHHAVTMDHQDQLEDYIILVIEDCNLRHLD